MSNRVRWTLIGIGIFVVVAGIAAAVVLVPVFRGTGPVPVEAQVTVEEIINQVETNRPRGVGGGASNFFPAQIGQNLVAGDGIKTFPESEARVDILVQDFLRIVRTTPNTIWRLGQFAVGQDTIIELDQGKIFLLDEGFRPDRPIKVVTPAGTASPRGSWWSAAYDPQIREAEFEVFRGSLEVKNDLGTQVLIDEQKTTVTPETAPTPPVYLAPDELDNFTELPEAKRKEVVIPAPVVVPPTLTPTPVPPAPVPAAPPIPAPEPRELPEAPPGSKPEPEAPPESKPEPEAPPGSEPEPEAPPGSEPESEDPSGPEPEPEAPEAPEPEPPEPPMPPTGSITSPTTGDAFLTTDSIAFSGSATDPEDGVLTGASLVWTSSLDGQIGTGTSFRASLSAGRHTITLTATDSDGASGSASIKITVDTPPNAPPTATITSPTTGDTFLTTDNIAFSGSATDPEDGGLTGASLVWTSSQAGQIGTGESFSASLSAGSHTITLTATDSDGASGSATIGITVNAPPAASITSPTTGNTFLTADSILFTGSATDPEDGTLTEASLVWTSSLDGPIGAGVFFSASLSAGSHTVTLTATDSDGASGSASVSITVNTPAPLPPRATGGFPHLFGGTVTIDGVPATDGTIVTAWVREFRDPVGENVVTGGSYVVFVFQYGTGSFQGKTITFKIGSFDANETGIWGVTDELNLTANR